MSEVFLTSDTHFGHKNIIKFRTKVRTFSCPEEHDQYLEERWNSVVGKNDVVIHVGDVAWNRESMEVFNRLKGHKHLVMGNHDTLPIDLYLRHFSKIHGAYSKGDALITHIPVVEDEILGRWKVNLHGHLHEYVMNTEVHINVSPDHFDLAPVPFDVAIAAVQMHPTQKGKMVL